ncbi:MAG: archaeosortase/exosortase family protein [Candidatus Aenigmarchaeota archaeon]|nr:archaeosortase/exosortase family protein [Candidatus Aenigmarchaeota archaeon]
MKSLEFSLKLSALSAMLYSAPLMNIDFLPVREMIASHAASFLGFLGQAVSRDGTLLMLGNSEIAITRDCVPWKLTLFFFSLTLLSSATIRKKAAMLSSFIVMVYAANIARIAVLSYSAAFGEQLFWLVHFVFQAAFIAFAVGYWALWRR